jgi:hypothetical protein
MGRIALATAGLVLAGMAATTIAGSAADEPSMEVLPSATGLKYSQGVEVRGHHLPKGSGLVAATICGLNDAGGARIAEPTADDCAGQAELGKLVQVKKWEENGEFATPYTLPASGQKFGTNQRFCDATHHCALVVADANPDAPAYHLQTVIQFADQQPFDDGTGSPTTPSSPSSPTTGAPAPTPAPGGGDPGTAPPSGVPTTPTPSTPTTQPADDEPDETRLDIDVHVQGSVVPPELPSGLPVPAGGVPELPLDPTQLQSALAPVLAPLAPALGNLP